MNLKIKKEESKVEFVLFFKFNFPIRITIIIIKYK